jgi:hypothetical protein
MAKTSGIDRRGFVAGTFALGSVGAAADAGPAASAQNSVREWTVTTATIDGLEVSYVTHGAGPALLMLAPGGFDATMEKWTSIARLGTCWDQPNHSLEADPPLAQHEYAQNPPPPVPSGAAERY